MFQIEKKEGRMKRITFRQFINSYNFRYCYTNDDKEIINDTTTIRIYLPNDNEDTSDFWFELGVYDFCDRTKRKIIERSLSDEVKNSYVDVISYNDQFERVVTIYLTNIEEKKEEL